MNDNVIKVPIADAAFRKSSASEGGGDCVEVARVEGVAVRDSKDPAGPVLWFSLQEWAAFVVGIVTGEFDFS